MEEPVTPAELRDRMSLLIGPMDPKPEPARVWTPAHVNSNPWRSSWFAKEPCPGCGQHDIHMECADCESIEWTGTVEPHDGCVFEAECMSCGWNETRDG